MRYTFTVLTNETRGSRFIDFSNGDKVRFAAVVKVEADDVNEALNRLYAVGNRMEEDADGREWPRLVRSMSVGDLILWGNAGPEPNQLAWSVADFGFDAEGYVSLTLLEDGFLAHRAREPRY